MAQLLAPIVLMACSALVIGLRLGQPEFPYFDEIFYVASIHDIRAGLGMGEATHPPLVKELMLASVAMLGDEPIAWRLPSFVSGVALVGIVFGVMRRCGSSTLVAASTALLVAIDGLCITQARVGILNAPCVALGFGAVLAALHRKGWLAGLLLGCAVAGKFVGLAFIPVVALALMWGVRANTEHPRGVSYRAIAGLLLLTSIVYLTSFIPLLRYMSSLWSGIVLYHAQMFEHHLRDASIVHRYGSPWWGWPFLLRPIWYGFEEVGREGLIRGVLCIANPATAAFVVAGVALACLRWFRSKAISLGEGIALLGFVSNLLPWAFSPRLTMFHYYYPAYVFGIILFGLQLNHLSSRARWIVILATLSASFWMFIYWYPLWTAMPIDRARYESMIWFSSWR